MTKDNEFLLSPELSEQVLEVAELIGITPDEVANAIFRVGLKGLKTNPDYLKSKDFGEKLIEEVERLRRK